MIISFNWLCIFQLRSVPDGADLCSIGLISRLSDLLLTIVVFKPSRFPPHHSIPDEFRLPPRQHFIRNFLDTPENQITKGFVVELASAFHLNRHKFEGPGHYRSVLQRIR